MKILLRTDLDTFDSDGPGLVTALLKRGVELHLEPLRVAPPIPADAAVLLTLPRPDSYDLVLHLCRPEQLGLNGKADNEIAVAWTALNSVDALPGNIDELLTGYDLIVGHDVDTTERLTRGRTIPGATAHRGFWAKDWPEVSRDYDNGHFAFCVIDEYFHAASIIAAFTELCREFPQEFENVELNVKTERPATPISKHPKVRYFDGRWDPTTLHDFYADQHVLIAGDSPNDRHALQFLSTGGTVIAPRTATTGQWLSSAIGYCVSGPDNRRDEDYQGAMLRVIRDRHGAALRAERASDLIADMCSWDNTIDRLLLLIGDALPGVGERLRHTARVAQERAKDRSRR